MFNLLRRLLTTEQQPVQEECSEYLKSILKMSLLNSTKTKKMLEDMLDNENFSEKSSEIKDQIAYLEKQISLLKSDAPVHEKLNFYTDSLNILL